VPVVDSGEVVSCQAELYALLFLFFWHRELCVYACVCVCVYVCVITVTFSNLVISDWLAGGVQCRWPSVHAASE